PAFFALPAFFAVAPTYMRLDPLEQLAEANRLDLEVDSAFLPGGHTQRLVRRRRDHPHGEFAPAWVSLERAQHGEAVDAGHHHVEEEQVRVDLTPVDHGEYLRSAGGGGHLVAACGERPVQPLEEDGIVFGNE